MASRSWKRTYGKRRIALRRIEGKLELRLQAANARSYTDLMTTITLSELQQNLESVLGRVEAGEHVVVSRGGKLIAELCPPAVEQIGPRPYGLAAGQFTVPTDFDAPLPESVIADFER